MSIIPQGRFLGSYAAASAPFVAAADAAPFSTLTGAANKIIKLKKVKVSGLHLTAVEYLNILVGKYSSAASGGTSAAMVETPLMSSYPAAAGVGLTYTGAPTAGTSVGKIASTTVMGQATTEAASDLPAVVEFDFSDKDVVLLSAVQQFGVHFGAAPATGVTVSVEWEWDEFSN